MLHHLKLDMPVARQCHCGRLCSTFAHRVVGCFRRCCQGIGVGGSVALPTAGIPRQRACCSAPSGLDRRCVGRRASSSALGATAAQGPAGTQPQTGQCARHETPGEQSKPLLQWTPRSGVSDNHRKLLYFLFMLGAVQRLTIY